MEYAIDSSFFIEIFDKKRCVFPKEALDEIKNPIIKEFVGNFCKIKEAKPDEFSYKNILKLEALKNLNIRKIEDKDLENIWNRRVMELGLDYINYNYSKRKKNAMIDSEFLTIGDKTITSDKILFDVCKLKRGEDKCIFIKN